MNNTKRVPCNGGCGKYWPQDDGSWHHNMGILVSPHLDAAIEGDEYNANEPAKMCEDCFQKLPDAKKSDWPLF